MNNIFSFKRFGRYASTEFRASRRQFLRIIWLTAAIQIGLVIILTLLFQSPLSETNNSLFNFMMFCLGIVVLIMISNAFRGYHNSMSAPRMMMLPVSMCEKFTYAFLHNIIFIPLVLFGIIVLNKILVGSFTGQEVTIFQSISASHDNVSLNITINPYAELFLDGLLFSTIYLLGAALFRRAQCFLTSVSLIGLMTLIGGAFILYLLPTIKEGGPNAQFIEQEIDLDYIGKITTYIAIPLVIAGAWLRFRSLQLKK